MEVNGFSLIMQSKKVSFVGANIEVGQAFKGLTQSSRQFLLYLKESGQDIPFELNPDFNVTAEIQEKSQKSFTSDDLNKMNFSAYQKLSQINDTILRSKNIPLNFGGDHSVALSTIESSLRQNRSTHVIWIDAHADANCAEQSATGSFHGMPVYYLMVNKRNRPSSLDWMRTSLHPGQITYVGLRDLDPFEIILLNDLQIDYFTSDEVKAHGFQKVIETIKLKNQLFEKIHLSFDIDSLDPNYGLCTGVPANNGLKVEDVEKLFKLIQQTGKLSNVDFVEINPALANDPNELKQVYQLAYSLIQNVLPLTVNSMHNFKEEDHAFISY